MDINLDNLRVTHMSAYAAFLAVHGVVTTTIAQVTEPKGEKKVLIAICLVLLVVNFAVALSMFTQTRAQDKDWKTIIFKLTGILSVYFAFSVMLPGWFVWPGCVIICAIVACVEGHTKMKPIYDWSYEKITKFLKFLGSEVPARAADNPGANGANDAPGVAIETV